MNLKMDKYEYKLNKIRDFTIKYNAELLMMANVSFVMAAHGYCMSQLVKATAAMNQANEYRKKFEIRYELNKPFLQKLYEMSGRGY